MARVAALGEKISPIIYSVSGIDRVIQNELKVKTKAYNTHIQRFHFNEALGEIWQIISFADRYINTEKPWTIHDEKKLFSIVKNTSFLILGIQHMVKPFLPETAENITKQFWLKKSILHIKKGAALFPRLM